MATVINEGDITIKVSKMPDEIEKQKELNVKNALKAMVDAMLQRTQILEGNGVPIKDDVLHTTGVTDTRENGLLAFVQFGNGLKYARYQEFGPDGNKYTGKKKVWDYTTPGTGAHYLKTAGDSVKKEGIKNYL